LLGAFFRILEIILEELSLVFYWEACSFSPPKRKESLKRTWNKFRRLLSFPKLGAFEQGRGLPKSSKQVHKQ
jgi:hypothetical protein